MLDKGRVPRSAKCVKEGSTLLAYVMPLFFFFFFLLLFATPQLLGMLTFFLCHLRAQPGLKFFLPQTHHIFIIFQAKEVHIQRC